ncbi:MAG: putative adhesin, partial [Bacteroidota bacterium]
MKLRILILILTCSNIAFAQAPKWDWVKGFGGNQQVNGNGITTDMNNNVYVVGGFICDTFFFGNSFFKKSSVNSSDYFLLKISSSGNVVWARKSYTLSDFNGGNAVAVDNQNNVIVGGNFNGHEIDFGNSIKLYNSSISQPGNGFSVDVFIIKYNASGAIKW